MKGGSLVISNCTARTHGKTCMCTEIFSQGLIQWKNLSHLPPTSNFSPLMISAPQLYQIMMYTILDCIWLVFPLGILRVRTTDLVMHSMLIGFASKTLQCILKD